MTKEEFYKKIVLNKRFQPNQRMGQFVFNVMWEFYPEVADTLRGSSVDPFYRSERIENFVDECFKMIELKK